MEMELKVDSNSMSQLLKFLTGGFNGGTDVDKPLELSLKRLSEKEWNQVLMLGYFTSIVPEARPYFLAVHHYNCTLVSAQEVMRALSCVSHMRIWRYGGVSQGREQLRDWVCVACCRLTY